MAARFALVYVRNRPDLDFDEVCSLVKPLGLKVLHPLENDAFVLTEAGDQLAIRVEDLRACVDHGQDTTFELWYAADHDVICRSRLAHGVRVVAFSLEGTDEAERAALRDLLLERFGEDSVFDVLGVVFDGEGITAHHDWDALFVHGRPLFAGDLAAGLPEVLFVNVELTAHLHGFSAHRKGRIVSIA